ncbi:unnamed protein product [Mytilus coruscus]|uniref:Ig-like domain-containing protein n=1 Tax=Mytilus coruscus TaxID=42192 RepID=A0A6J8EKP5_MYTCO|nr:unnamed protein product [Mytilus coruscus]
MCVVIEGSTGGLLGENGTKIECLYTQKDISYVSFLAFNKSSITFETIATYRPDKPPLLNTQGQYLKGRVTLMPIKKLSAKAVMIFNKLMCIDDTFYRCEMIYFDSNGNLILVSNNMSISVQVPPSKPDSVLLVHTPADSSVPTTKHMDYSSSSPSTAVTSNENNTVSASETAKQNTTTAFNHSTIQISSHNTITSTPSHEDISTNSSHRTTTYSIQQTTTALGIAEGDNITVVCTGNVGKPPVEHVFQKYLNGKIVPMKDTVRTTSIPDRPENCSYYRTSNLTFQVMADDNNAVIRCVVNSSMAELDIYPNKTDYVLGEDTSIHFNCKSNGNPKPYYYWYKENPKEQVGLNENFTITNMNITNSGTYTCAANNSFHSETYQKAVNVKVKIINEVTGIVIVIVVLGVVIAVIYVLYRRNIKIEDYKPVDNMESNTDQIEYQKAKRGVPSTNSTKKTTGYEDVDLDNTDMKFKPLSNEETIAKVKQDNDEYLKKQKEDEDKEKDNPTTPPQAAMYACVNKPKFTVTIENNTTAGQQEEDLYEESKEGIYDTSGDRRHKENITAENYNSTENLKNEESDHDEQKSQVGAYINKAFENDSGNKEEKRQVATVSPTVRLSFGYQGDGQKNKSNEIQPKNTNQPVKPKGQTGSTEKQSNQETSL